jgi:Flp pilus assembly protein TadD
MQKIFQYLAKPVLILAFFLILSFINFGSNLHSEFMIDDFDLIVDQSSVKSALLTDFYQHFIPDYKAHEKIEDAPSAVYYRPVAHLIPFVQSVFFGLDPFGYHFTNIVLFSLACLCFYFLLFVVSADRRLAFLAATLFCLHPINGLMVNYITASVYAAQLIFLSLSVILALRLPQLIFLPVALMMFVLALLCHETSLMLPAYLFVIAWHRDRKLSAGFKKAVPFIFIAMLYLGMRFYFANIQHSVLTKASQYPDLNALNYFATFFKLIAWYIAKYITMQGMVIIWSTPLVKEDLVFWLMGGVAAITLTILTFGRWKNSSKEVYIWWFVLGLAPVTLGSLFIPATGMMIEPHWLFFASLGLFALAAGVFLKIAERITPKIQVLSFVGLCAILLVASWNNNAFWKDELTFTRHWVNQVPTNKNAAFFYATALFKHGHLTEAKQWFLQSLMNKRNDWQNYNNLAAISLQENNEAQALDYFQKALLVFPQSATVYNNLGTYYLKKRDFVKAEEYLRQAQVLNPYQPEALLNLGVVYEGQQRWELAWKSYLQAYALRPKDERVLGVLLWTALNDRGDGELIARAEEFLRDIHSEELLTRLGDQFAISGRNELAVKYLLKAIELYPHEVAAYREVGKVLANAGHFPQAEAMWKMGLQQDPKDQQLRDLLKELAVVKAQAKD